MNPIGCSHVNESGPDGDQEWLMNDQGLIRRFQSGCELTAETDEQAGLLIQERWQRTSMVPRVRVPE